MVIMRFDFKSLKDKISNSTSSPSLSQRENVRGIEGSSSLHFWRAFRERVCFSLENREIRPLAGFGTRRRNVLRGAGYVSTPGSGVSSNSLR